MAPVLLNFALQCRAVQPKRFCLFKFAPLCSNSCMTPVLLLYVASWSANHINDINRHSFIQQANHLTDVTITRCKSEVFDELWIDFYGRNKRSNKTVSSVRISCPPFTLFNHLISFKQ